MKNLVINIAFSTSFGKFIAKRRRDAIKARLR